MPIHVDISDDLEDDLRKRAKASGVDPETFALDAIRDAVQACAREDRLAPIRQAFASSGLTEDEAVELFEQEKHALRRERRELRAKAEEIVAKAEERHALRHERRESAG